MNVRYPCQCCKNETAGGTLMLRKPGVIKMGRMMIEQMVCHDCHNECCDALNKNIWGHAKGTGPNQCKMCGGPFGAEGQFYAHNKPLESGDWELAMVCSGCFDKFHDCCKKIG